MASAYRRKCLKIERRLRNNERRIEKLNEFIRDSDVTCQLRMDRRTFHILCEMLRDVGGLKSTRNMTLEEIVAQFLYTLSHHLKNRTIGKIFYRSDMNSSESSTIVHGRGKNKRKWVPAEDDVLIKALHDVSLDPRWRSDGSFKNGHTSVLEARLAEKLPGAKISAIPHNHPDAKGLYGVPFPYYDVLAAIYSKDIATGEGAEDLTDAISNMEQELAAGNGNDEEEEDAQETPRRSVDSTSSSSKKRKKEWKGKKDSVTSDPLLDMFNEVVTKSIGKMAQTMERDTTNQKKSMNEDPQQKLGEKAVNEVRRLEFTGAKVIQAALVFSKMPDQMGMMFALPEPKKGIHCEYATW
ncbi:uncharacterized protein C2845_PMPSC055470 [Panicum miliaceum]|uniref:Myb/SANT-like domain-containing protein n=2 Tax=Panicum miliaceum TaxID=4540 RepID=A0A3L6P9P8_PANMI|nr:uncharacterized protein C2845_PMPSC055470 [Panicum miliaceum]